MKKLILDNLVIEIGRCCNLNCSHCLRGQADNNENLEITKEIINRIFKNVSNIDTLTLTGGEPFLYPEIMLYIANIIKRKKISLCSFFIATNGTIKSEKAMLAIMKLYELSEQKDWCQIKISDDEFHQQERMLNNLEIDETLDLFSINHRDQTKYTADNLINQGNAVLNHEARKNVNDDGMIATEDEIMHELNTENIIYINTNGDVLTGCDYSYENQKYASYGNILENSLYDIIKNNI